MAGLFDLIADGLQWNLIPTRIQLIVVALDKRLQTKTWIHIKGESSLKQKHYCNGILSDNLGLMISKNGLKNQSKLRAIRT